MNSNELDIENLRETILLSDSKVWGIVSQQKGVGKSYIAKKLDDHLQKSGKTVLYLECGAGEENSVSLEEEMKNLPAVEEDSRALKSRKIFMSDRAGIEKLVYDESFEKLIDTYRNRFDYVLVDMMSLEENSIAKRISSICDNNLFVLAKDTQNGIELRKVIDQLCDVNVRIAGVVMNEYHEKRSWLRA
nr:hypothetical protein [uncultured Mediterraneibacter sp.]